jgi:hypothetical protein
MSYTLYSGIHDSVIDSDGGMKMGKRTSKPPAQRVTPRTDGTWQHKQDGNKRATSVTNTQRKAIQSAVNAARRKRSEVVIHGKDGRIRSKDSYGNDPFPPRDTEH